MDTYSASGPREHSVQDHIRRTAVFAAVPAYIPDCTLSESCGDKAVFAESVITYDRRLVVTVMDGGVLCTTSAAPPPCGLELLRRAKTLANVQQSKWFVKHCPHPNEVSLR